MSATIQDGLTNLKNDTVTDAAQKQSEQVKTAQSAPPVPMDKNDAFIRGILAILQGRLFEFHYRAKFRPQMAFILAYSLEDARSKAENYCDKFRLRYISVTPFFLDLNKNPREETANESQYM